AAPRSTRAARRRASSSSAGARSASRPAATAARSTRSRPAASSTRGAAPGGWRAGGEREGDIRIVVFGEGDTRGWFWLIPFRDGRTSIGAVVSSAWVRARPKLGGPEGLFLAALAEAPVVASMVEGAERLFVPEATADFSFRVGARRGDGWVAIGDSGGFI